MEDIETQDAQENLLNQIKQNKSDVTTFMA